MKISAPRKKFLCRRANDLYVLVGRINCSMNIHEYQAQNLFENFGIPVPSGVLLRHGDDVDAAVNALNFDRICLKAQIHAGGRGKGHFSRDIGHGGVRVAISKGEAASAAKNMLSNTLITEQTGPTGRVVTKLYLVETVEISRAYYAAILLDRKSRCHTLILSTEGGVDIETVAEKFPQKIHRVAIDPLFGLMPYQIAEISYGIGLQKEQVLELTRLLLNLYALYCEKDCTLVEINPLAMLKDGHFVAVDSKINFDDNAIARHPEIAELRDTAEEDANEVEASRHSLNYISLDGNIACVVNGAGLAMATLDIIKSCGGSPANFLDIGGGATEEHIGRAFEVILKIPRMRGILVNIFGGIVKCDTVAQGIIGAARTMNLQLPLVVRLEGTNVERGRQLLSESGLRITAATGLDDAARRIVELSNLGET
ncbi:MAG: ADP-forming succinate--CoA ligase subunit beta [Puniceicoccales bacterium]|nr:ADP-forming succinate--CoA ligase subunit beta [Puniceicoccales bacterium]